MSRRSLDLRGTPCPVNFIRCKLTLEQMSSGDCLEVCLDRGEPEAMVLDGDCIWRLINALDTLTSIP